MGKMAHWAFVFAVLTLIYGALGFGGLDGVAATFAKFLFAATFLLAVITSVASLFSTHD